MVLTVQVAVQARCSKAYTSRNESWNNLSPIHRTGQKLLGDSWSSLVSFMRFFNGDRSIRVNQLITISSEVLMM